MELREALTTTPATRTFTDELVGDHEIAGSSTSRGFFKVAATARAGTCW